MSDLRANDFLGGPSQAYLHNGDYGLLKELGLQTGNFGRDWTDLGTVTVREAEEDGEYGARPATTVKVEVTALPAQFWRFTITRPRDDSKKIGHPDGSWEVIGIYEPVETIVLTTGSGGFSTYWPTVERFAEHMISVRTDANRWSEFFTEELDELAAAMAFTEDGGDPRAMRLAEALRTELERRH